MADKRAKLLQDVAVAGQAIGDFISGKSLADYRANLMMRSAVERQFEIVGEALRRLHALDPVFAARITRSSEIISFRNVIAHGYDVVDAMVVWGIIEDDLPALAVEVQALLDELARTA